MRTTREKLVTVTVDPSAMSRAPRLARSTANLKAWIEAKPGAEGRPFSPGRNATPLVVIYKVKGKVFAILSVRGVEDVILKCEPSLASALREKYTGVGHRSHLDRRFWISVRLDMDVPGKEVKRLVTSSYDLVCAGLTAKQRAELAGSFSR